MQPLISRPMSVAGAKRPVSIGSRITVRPFFSQTLPLSVYCSGPQDGSSHFKSPSLAAHASPWQIVQKAPSGMAKCKAAKEYLSEFENGKHKTEAELLVKECEARERDRLNLDSIEQIRRDAALTSTRRRNPKTGSLTCTTGSRFTKMSVFSSMSGWCNSPGRPGAEDRSNPCLYAVQRNSRHPRS